MTITLISSNGDRFDATQYACFHCKTIAYFIDEDPNVEEIPLPMVDAHRISRILQFFEKRLQIVREIKCDPSLTDEHTLDSDESNRLRVRSSLLFSDESTTDLLESIVAANYLNCEVLLDVLSGVIASRISGKSRDEMREILGIENDFTAEEEARVLEENKWAFV